ncbi:putative methyltransferase-domain-containing protein [Amylocarpus encephaloides]|uniref:Methyltransferase-domain-containing protein n=1 Tax=Amylocarpus encephaloides TaxID=45428 RepID=A0A9P7YE70_9HELO|nr:putative methyltransferase-domain-containing protein [Amylocarpus encephaloides]
MHYIRFLKAPRLIDNSMRNAPSSISAKITITTDLGESFLRANVTLDVLLVAEDESLVLVDPKELVWRGEDGMRALEVAFQIPARLKKSHEGPVRVIVKARPMKTALGRSIRSFTSVLSQQESEGGIVEVGSMAIVLNPVPSKTVQPSLARRQLWNGRGEAIEIWEETGESIARHVWDAGLVFSAYLSRVADNLSLSKPQPKTLPVLEDVLLKGSRLKVIELGAGCGIVGITLASSLSNIDQILLTDLPEASEILETNIAASRARKPANPSPSADVSHHVLDWSSPLRQPVSITKWDLVLVADCTYNPDVVPDLVSTLGKLRAANREVLVALAMKVRHESEMVFFELMEREGWAVREKCRFRLPVLGGEEEGIEVWVFGEGGLVSYRA